MEGGEAVNTVVDTVREDTKVEGVVVAAEAVVDTVRKATGVGVILVAEEVVDPVEEDVGWEAGAGLEEVISTAVREVVIGAELRPELVLALVAVTTLSGTPIVVAFTIGSRLKAPPAHDTSFVSGGTLQL